MKKTTNKPSRRILARNLAHPLSVEELEKVNGGLVGTSTSDTCSGGTFDDCGADD